jgi:YD repeat-containing protein
LGRGTSVTDAASGVVSTTFDKDNNVLTTEDQLGNLVTNVWNSRSELVEQDLPDPDGTGPLAAPVLHFTYSAAGQELTSSDGLGRLTTKIYDEMGRLIETDLPDPDGSGPLTSPAITTAYDRIRAQCRKPTPSAIRRSRLTAIPTSAKRQASQRPTPMAAGRWPRR